MNHNDSYALLIAAIAAIVLIVIYAVLHAGVR